MKGFTLIEILIALAIFAIASFGIYGLLNQCLYAEDWTEKRLELVFDTTEFLSLGKITNEWERGIETWVNKEKFDFYNIIEVKWGFKKNGIEISYVSYYQKGI